MFSSPCSLRSAQCATLIALAAAAGLSRFEPVEQPPAASTAPATAAPSHTRFSAPFFVAASVSEWTPLPYSVAASASVRTPGCALGPAPAAIALIPPLVPNSPRRPAFATPALSSRKHAHPYAVGPPALEIAHPLRAAGLARPGDSSARRTPVSRIARVSFSAPGAPVIRTRDGRPLLAASPSRPGPTPFRHASVARAATAFSP